MKSRPYSGALTAGLILIALGVIFLIEGFYAPFSAWRLIGRYWPIIPIIIGLKKLFVYFTWPAIPSAPDKASSKE
jgi:cadmium resistance protein CadD (predicted permease)